MRAHSRNEVKWRSYNGAGNIEEFTGGFVRFFDLSLPLSLPRADWVLSLEVGEHLPHALEPTFVRNLHAHACKGIIVSWADLGQVGTGHINNHNASYVSRLFTDLGYTRHEGLIRMLRTSGRKVDERLPLRKNVLAFVRNASTRCTPDF